MEHRVKPTLIWLLQQQGRDAHEVYSASVHAKRNGEAIEIDLLVVNDGATAAVECKSKLTEAHIDRHVQRMEKIKRVLPT